MNYQVAVKDVVARPTAVVPAATTWREFPALWKELLDEALPAGQVAVTVHRGSFAGLDSAHRAVLDWCTAQERQPAGPRWEVYGPHSDDPAQVWVEVYWLLS